MTRALKTPRVQVPCWTIQPALCPNFHSFHAGMALSVRTRAHSPRVFTSRRQFPRWRWKPALAAVLLVSVSTAALAADPPPQVSAIHQSAAPATSAAVNSAGPPDPSKTWPPAEPELLSPSARLGPKARHGIALVHRWASRPIMPAPGPDGEVRYIYGASQATLVCAPLQVCDLSLQPGEIVQNVNIGDSTMWNCPPGVSGSGANQTTHLLCKPADAGLRTTLVILTNRRSYSIELVSTRHEFMRRVAFSYPDDQAAQWGQYQQQIGAQLHQPPPSSGYIRYSISGDNPPWRPIEAYSDGQKTWIWFPPSMAYGKAPVLERLN